MKFRMRRGMKAFAKSAVARGSDATKTRRNYGRE
jgi:hypothetical protein